MSGIKKGLVVGPGVSMESMVAVKFILQFLAETVIYVNFPFHPSTPSPGNRSF